MKGPFHDYLYNQHVEMAKNLSGLAFNGMTTKIFSTFAASSLTSMGCESVLDFGSGSGIDKDASNVGHENMRKIASADIEIFGYEPSMKSKLHTSENSLVNQSYLSSSSAQMSGNFLPFENGQFDASMSFDVIEHLHQFDAALVVPELFRVAKTCVIANISCIPAQKKLPNGFNCHTSLFDPSVWMMMFWQESLRTGTSFSLFTTISKHNYCFTHNLPLKSSFESFGTASFSEGKFFTLKNQNLLGFESNHSRWMNSHIETFFEYKK